jgi:hypothetical protein
MYMNMEPYGQKHVYTSIQTHTYTDTRLYKFVCIHSDTGSINIWKYMHKLKNTIIEEHNNVHLI